MGKFYQLFAGSFLLIVLGFLCDFSTSKAAVPPKFNFQLQRTFSTNYQASHSSNDAERISRKHLSMAAAIHHCQVHQSSDDHHNGSLTFRCILPVCFSISSFNAGYTNNIDVNENLLSMREKLFANFYSHHAFW